MAEEYSDAPDFDTNPNAMVNPRKLKLQERKNLNYVRRGMGKSGITHRGMTDSERMTILRLVASGYTYEEVGEKVHRSASTVRGVMFQVKKADKAAGLQVNWREDLKERSVTAIRAGLDHGKDPYKRATIGVSTLKGLGEFESESQVHIATLLNSIPESQRDRYVTLDASDAIEIEGHEIPVSDADDPVEDEPKAEPDTEDSAPDGDTA